MQNLQLHGQQQRKYVFIRQRYNSIDDVCSKEICRLMQFAKKPKEYSSPSFFPIHFYPLFPLPTSKRPYKKHIANKIAEQKHALFVSRKFCECRLNVLVLSFHRPEAYNIQDIYITFFSFFPDQVSLYQIMYVKKCIVTL